MVWRARYSDGFAETGPVEFQHFKHMIDNIEALLDLLSDPKTSFLVKLMDYAKVRDDVSEFCWFYARWLGSPLAERLRAEIHQLLEEAMTWWVDGIR